MKKLLNALYEIGLSIEQSMVAGALVRAGMHEEAKELILAR